jgi:hypothetical protein
MTVRPSSRCTAATHGDLGRMKAKEKSMLQLELKQVPEPERRSTRSRNHAAQSSTATPICCSD